VQWYPIAEAVQRVFSGEIVNSLAVAGILAAYAVSRGIAEPRPVDAPWTDRPTAFSARLATR
ncbi:MAG: NUDIX hydrolase, partial [Mycobacterium sp.]